MNSLGDQPHLSLVLQHSWDLKDSGSGVILSNDYEVKRKLPLRSDLGAFDIHEFKIRDDGKTALVTLYLTHEITLEDFGRPENKTALLSGGFAELDLSTAQVIHEWDSFNHIPLPETVHYGVNSPVEGPPGWDYVHINSVDKNDKGDYMISTRFTNTIYLISGKDGHIIWRLGGRKSDFVQDFNFSKQHDAKFIEFNGTRHVISFLNNASDEEFSEETVSAAMIVELDTGVTPMTARVIRRYNRPDNGLSRLRGNTQLLPNDNVFVCWSQGGYISEFSPEGKHLFSAQFTLPRFSTYRAYKFEFTGRPRAPPDIVASVTGTDASNLVTTFWISWNGATDVAWWHIYAQASEFDNPVLIDKTPRTDFEIMYIASGYLDWVSAEAVDSRGHILGTSKVHRSKYPDWKSVGYNKGQSGWPTPQNPATLYPVTSTWNGSATDKDNVSHGPLVPSPEAAEAQSLKAIQVLSSTSHAVRGIGGFFAFAVLVCLVSGLVVGFMVMRGWRVQLYQRPSMECLPEEQARLRFHPLG